jgi:DNA-directed RNA polymerase specialized sigma24 family protein
MSTASTVMYTTPLSAQESHSNSVSVSNDSLRLTTTPSQRSSGKQSRSSSKANVQETLFQSMKGKTTNEFVEYANNNIRQIMISDFAAYRRFVSDLELESYWQEIALMIWRKAIVADEFESIHNFTAWCFSYMKKFHIWTRESDFMRGTHSSKSEQIFNTYYMTDVIDEELNRTLVRAAKHKYQEQPQLGLNTGWVTDALNRMTERERTSILCVKVVGMSRKDTADTLGSTDSSVRSAIKIARKKIVNAQPTLPNGTA